MSRSTKEPWRPTRAEYWCIVAVVAFAIYAIIAVVAGRMV